MAKPSDVLCAGIIVADHVCTPVSHLPAAGELVLADRILLTIGGCAANVAVDLARLDVPATVVGRVGGDVMGRVVADMLREQHVDVSGLRVSPDADTSQTLIVNVHGQDRRFIHSTGANDQFSAGDIPLALVERCKVLYLGGYLLMKGMKQDALAAVFATARRSGAKTVLDVVCPGPGKYLEQLDELLPQVDVFLPNGHEAELITGKKDPLAQAEQFHRLGASTAVITLGGEGAVVVSDRARLKVGVYPVEFVDGSGGGDAFDAGYIHGLLAGMDTLGCLKFATALGASCVRSVGTTTGVFTRRDCEEFIRQHELPVQKL